MLSIQILNKITSLQERLHIASFVYHQITINSIQNQSKKKSYNKNCYLKIDPFGCVTFCVQHRFYTTFYTSKTEKSAIRCELPLVDFSSLGYAIYLFLLKTIDYLIESSGSYHSFIWITYLHT